MNEIDSDNVIMTRHQSDSIEAQIVIGMVYYKNIRILREPLIFKF